MSTDLLAYQPLRGLLNYPAIALDSAATTISTSNAIDFAIDGIVYQHAAMTNHATPTTDAVTGVAFVAVPANYGSNYVLGLGYDGTLKAVQGSVEKLDASGAFYKAPQFGPIPADFCPFANVLVRAGSTASSSPGWVFGTSNFSGVTGITLSAQNGLPPRPRST